MLCNGSEEEGSAGSGGSQKLGGHIALVVTSEESLSGPRSDIAEYGSGEESDPCMERKCVTGQPVKTYGAMTETRLAVISHLSVHHGSPHKKGTRKRRITVHTFSDLRELEALSEVISTSSGLDSRHHSCSVIDSSKEKAAFDSNKLFATRHPADGWRSWDDLRPSTKRSTSEGFSDGSGLSEYSGGCMKVNSTGFDLKSGSDAGSEGQSSFDNSRNVSSLDVPHATQLTSVTSCCSLGHAASSDSVHWGRHPTFDERSIQSDPASGVKDDSLLPNQEPRQNNSEFPTFEFDSSKETKSEDLSFLARLTSSRGYGSSYRGLVSGGDPNPDPDKDSVDTGSISTMQTLQYEYMDDTPAWRIGIEVLVPFLLAGLGMVTAGLVLDSVQHWDVFTQISEVFILVPALLGLKGNLEMTLASRLSTQANLGNMDSTAEQWKMIAGNLALTQAQAIVVGFLAAVAAMVLGWIPEGKFDINHAFLLCCSSVLTAAFASFVLGTVMILVVLLSRKCHVNPDNVATPIAASLGDLTTLALLSGISSIMYKAIANSQLWLAPTLLFLFLGLTPIWCVVSHKNKYTHEILYSGWTPVIGAMVISSLGGLILDFAVGTYDGIAVFQPVINGVGGNLVAVQASRLSTALHRISTPGNLPEGAISGCPNIFSTFFGAGVNARTARVLMLLVVPGHLIFMYTIHYMNAGHTSITPIFAAVYLSAATLQVFLLLYLANWLVHWLWRRGNDPDNFSIPYLTAMGDLLGTGFLAAAFHFLDKVGHPVR